MTNLSNKIITLSDNKKTSIRLADIEWDALNIICQRENIKRNFLIQLINNHKDSNLGLTGSIRLFSVIYLQYAFLEKKQLPINHNRPQPPCPIHNAILGIL